MPQLERNPMQSRFALLLLASWLAASAVPAADVAKARQLMTLMRADEVVAAAMKTGLRNGKTGINLSDAQSACLNAVPHRVFSDAVTAALAAGLSDAELAAAIAFYRTPAGARYAQSIVAVTQGKALDKPLTSEELASVREFAATEAGDKLLKKALVPNSNAVADRMAQVSGDAIENCGKPPPK
jgi:hypothetical protein